ncbi:MAG TPA: hypothetical protein VF545_08665 [Thermoleophilaceae bacterium]|jgi:hypothetical protein
MSFRQAPRTAIDSTELRPIAVLSWAPDDFEQRRSIAFSEGQDDLDSYAYAVIVTDAGRQFVLHRYAGDPGEGTDIFVDAQEPDPDAALAEALGALDLDPEAVTWRVTPSIQKRIRARLEPDLVIAALGLSIFILGLAGGLHAPGVLTWGQTTLGLAVVVVSLLHRRLEHTRGRAQADKRYSMRAP